VSPAHTLRQDPGCCFDPHCSIGLPRHTPATRLAHLPPLCSAGAANSCTAGRAITLATTRPGEQGALASASEAFSLAISPDSGLVTIVQRATGAVTTLASPGANCHGPFEVSRAPHPWPACGLLVCLPAHTPRALLPLPPVP
jgi:hypothetical protein